MAPGVVLGLGCAFLGLSVYLRTVVRSWLGISDIPPDTQTSRVGRARNLWTRNQPNDGHEDAPAGSANAAAAARDV